MILTRSQNTKIPVLPVAALPPAKSQRSVIRFPGPKMRLGQQSLATPVHSRVVAWVVVCGILKVIVGNNNTNLAIRTPGKKHKGRPILVNLEVPLKK